ncbi:hypothetical protein GCM10009564_17540 [Streptomyces thermogriseus]|uniref:Uncharacterized protein n=1 Tax=Streptomyces thermogriseus TaxID=75292 RepID=A0ABP4DHF5_9ACTN
MFPPQSTPLPAQSTSPRWIGSSGAKPAALVNRLARGERPARSTGSAQSRRPGTAAGADASVPPSGSGVRGPLPP